MHASLRSRALVLALAAGLSSASSAAADTRAGEGRIARASISEPSGPDEPQEWLDVVPQRCAQFAAISPRSAARSADRPDPTYAWRQLLSLAACVQDGALAAATELDQLEAVVDDMSRRLALPMLIYLDALEHADAPIQLRAAFQIGMAYVSFSTRARSSIAAPPDLATNPAAGSRYRELHARLEPLLVSARRAAWISFYAIDEAARTDAALAGNEVERGMICTARRMLVELRDAAPERFMVAELPGCAAAPVTAATTAPAR